MPPRFSHRLQLVLMTVTVQLGLADLAGTRFAVSPLHETITALQVLLAPGRQPVHVPWRNWAEAELADRPLNLPLLWPLIAHQRPSWPEFLAPAPVSRTAGVDHQLAAVRDTDPAHVRASLRRVFCNDPPPPAVTLARDPAGGLRALAADLRTAFNRLIAPHWPRMQALLDLDISHRAQLLAARGPAGLLAGLHPAVSWQDGALTIAQGRKPRTIALGQDGLVLCPSIFGGPHVVIKGHTSTQTTLRYPVRGIAELWAAPTTAPSNPLVRLLGRPRARLLTALSSPATTTMLAHERRVSPSAVSQHLAVLRANGLITRDRTGRHVYYALTDSGRTLIEARPSP